MLVIFFVSFQESIIIAGLQIWVEIYKFIFLFLNQDICCKYSKEPSHWDGSVEHIKHMFRLIEMKVFKKFMFKTWFGVDFIDE